MLIIPFPESSLNQEAGKVFMEDYQEYFRIASIYTQVHANKGKIEQQQTQTSIECTSKTINKNNFDNNNIYHSDSNKFTMIIIDEGDKSCKNKNNSENISFMETNEINNNFTITNNCNSNNNSNNYRKSQKENILLKSSNEHSPTEDYYFKNIEDFSKIILNTKEPINNISDNNDNNNFYNFNNNYNSSIKESLLLRHSRSVFIKNENSVYNNILKPNSNNLFKNIAENCSNFTTSFRNSMFNNSIGISSTFNNNNFNHIFSNKNLNKISAEINTKDNVDSNFCTSFSTSNSYIINKSNQVENNIGERFENFENLINMQRKPSLDDLPFMRPHSQSLNEQNNFQRNSSMLINRCSIKSKKEEMKKWLSRI